MTDLFSMFAPSRDSEQLSYGMAGELKKTQYVLELVGDPHDPATLKCVLTAAEQGMEMNCYSLSRPLNAQVKQALSKISPFCVTPCLREADYLVCGGAAITEFINARGLGYSLTPQNAMLAAIQDYWVDIASNHLDDLVRHLINEQMGNCRKQRQHSPNQTLLNQLSKQISIYFELLNQQLEHNKFIVCNKYTWADLHWTVYAHLCEVMGCADLIERYENVSGWMQMIKGRKSVCGQDIVAYDYYQTRNRSLSLKWIL